ncbi:MAG TPA: 30S ribosomal protein S6 [Thermodesulfobacteriaceae bacterium]|nr:30S ribosomal protein S6 [Thermodesulfobacteriaceae bacterium]
MELRYYDTFYLLHPDLNDEERQAISEKLQNIVVESGGQVVKIDPWPLKKLAYKVQKQSHGYYVTMEYGAPSDALEEITRNLRLDENVMKFLTTKLSDAFDPALIAESREASSPEETAGEAAAPAESGEGE